MTNPYIFSRNSELHSKARKFDERRLRGLALGRWLNRKCRLDVSRLFCVKHR